MGAADSPILHLGTINPHVASTIQRPGMLLMPREPAPSAAAQPAEGQQTVFGVSAFAFQGTNAHALLAVQLGSEAATALVSPKILAWAKERHWIAPDPHVLVGSALRAGPAGVLFDTNLTHPKHAFLWDHAVGGRPLLPGAAFLEAAAACIQAAVAADEDSRVVVTGVTIPAPLELPAAAPPQSQPLLLRCQLEAGTGRVKLASAGPAGVREHMYGSVAAVAALDSNRLPPGTPLWNGSDSTTTSKARTAVAAGSAWKLRTSPAAAVGWVHRARADGRAGGRGVNPACTDASFHLGALPAVGQRATLRVPAAIGAYHAHARDAGADSAPLLAGCQPVSGSQHSIINDYWLANCITGSGCCCRVAGLEARALSRAPATTLPAMAAGAASLSNAEDEQRLLYQAAWAVSATADEPTSRLAIPTIRFQPVSQPSALCAAGIAALQAENCRSDFLLITQGLHTVVARPAAAKTDAAAASLLHGLMKAAALEQAGRNYAAEDADALASSAVATSTLAFGASQAAAGDVHGLAVRAGACLHPVLLPAPVPTPASQPKGQVQAAGAFLITGGTGTLGQLVAMHLAGSKVATRLVLLGRSGRLADASSAAGLLELAKEQHAIEMVTTMCDTAAAEDARAGCSLAAGDHQLAGLVHSGGVLADGILANLAPSQIRRVLAPKIASLACLLPATALQPAASQLLFSSVAALLGSPGQANYSAANALLDAMAEAAQAQVWSWMLGWSKFSRRLLCVPLAQLALATHPPLPILQGVSAVSVQWGAWAGGGMVSQDRSTALRVERMGMGLVGPAAGLAALQALLPSTLLLTVALPVAAAVPFKWSRLAQQAQRGSAVASLYSEFVPGAAPVARHEHSSEATTQPKAAARPALSLAAARAAVLADVQATLKALLGSEVGEQEPLMAAGLDSLASVELRNSLESKLALKVRCQAGDSVAGCSLHMQAWFHLHACCVPKAGRRMPWNPQFGG